VNFLSSLPYFVEVSLINIIKVEVEETVAGAAVAGELRGAEVGQRRQVGLLQGVGERLSILKNKFGGNVFFKKISRIFNT
jgi:hypothetical protein